MESFDIEQPAQNEGRKQQQHRWLLRRNKRAADGNQLIVLREYSMAICLIEALAIVLLVYLFLRLPANYLQEDSRYSQGMIGNSSAPYLTYSDHLRSARLLVGLAAGCTQRKHDLAHSVRCHGSSATGECTPVQQVSASQMRLASLKRGEYPQISIFETTKLGKRLEGRLETPVKRKVLCDHPDAGCPKIATRMVIRRDRKHQKIVGWGGALTDSAINNVLSLTTNATRNLLADYFGPNGLSFNMARVTIGGSDFSSRFYTNNDLPAKEGHLELLVPNATDWSMENFKLADEDKLYKIPMLRRIRDEWFGEWREFKVFASMWSPPVWLKTNRHFNQGHLRGTNPGEPLMGGGGARSKRSAAAVEATPDIGNDTLKSMAFEALAELKIKFIAAYRKAGVKLWGLTVMNEPIFAVQPFLNFNTMIFPRDDYARYVSEHLGPKLSENFDKIGPIQLMLHDDNRRFLTNYTAPLLRQARVLARVSGVSVHGYIDEDYWRMTDIYNEFNTGMLGNRSTSVERLFVLPTELCSGHLPWMEKALAGNWHRGVHYALDIIRSLQNMAAGWVDWNMALDMEGGPGWLGGRLDAPILVDKARDEYHRSPMFYALAHFSRYIEPGSRRVQLELSNARYDAHFETVAFESPLGEITIVIVNNNPYPVDVHWRLAPSSGLTEDAAEHEYFVTRSPADSIQTIIYEEQ